MSIKVTLGKEKILDSWFVLIDGAKGKGGEVIKRFVDFVEKSRAPGITIEEVKVFPHGGWKFLSGFFKRFDIGRNYVRVVNKDLGNVDMYVDAQDYGENLYVSWYLVIEPGFFDRLFPAEKAARLWRTTGGDILVEEELNAYVTCIHHCLFFSLAQRKLLGGILLFLFDPLRLHRTF